MVLSDKTVNKQYQVLLHAYEEVNDTLIYGSGEETEMWFTQGDRFKNIFIFDLYKDGIPVDLTNPKHTCRITYTLPATGDYREKFGNLFMQGNYIYYPGDVEFGMSTAPKNRLVIDISPVALAFAGRVKMLVSVYCDRETPYFGGIENLDKIPVDPQTGMPTYKVLTEGKLTFAPVNFRVRENGGIATEITEPLIIVENNSTYLTYEFFYDFIAETVQPVIDEAKEQIQVMYDLEDYVKVEEQKRQDNENTRKINETTRIASEIERMNKEAARIAAETVRISNENQRIIDENIRIAAETLRVQEFNQIKKEWYVDLKPEVLELLLTGMKIGITGKDSANRIVMNNNFDLIFSSLNPAITSVITKPDTNKIEVSSDIKWLVRV